MENTRLVELFGGLKRLQILRALFLNPGRPFRSRDLAELSGVSISFTNDMLNRWVTAGLVVKDVDGRNVLFRSSADPLFGGLTDMLLRSDAMLDDIRDALPETVEIAVIFGSVARGEEHAESDIDVLVLGADISRIKINAVLSLVGEKHHRVINASVYSTEEFATMLREGNGFATTVASQKTIPLKGDFHAISQTKGDCSR